MKQFFTVISFLLTATLQSAHACEPAGPYPQTVEQAYSDAKTVLHVKVTSKTGEVKLIKTYKGNYSGKIIKFPLLENKIPNMPACGEIYAELGAEHIVFIYPKEPSGEIWFPSVAFLPTQPRTTNSILKQLVEISK